MKISGSMHETKLKHLTRGCTVSWGQGINLCHSTGIHPFEGTYSKKKLNEGITVFKKFHLWSSIVVYDVTVIYVMNSVTTTHYITLLV